MDQKYHVMKPLVKWIDEDGFYIRGNYDPETGLSEPVGRLMLFDWQRDILEHVFTPDTMGNFPYTQIVISQPKKSGKTTIGGAIGAWFADQAVANSEIYVMAADHEQASDRIFDDIHFHERHDEESRTHTLKEEIRYENGTRIKTLANEGYSAAGSRHALTLWDELWTFHSDRDRLMWSEMTPISIPSVPVSMQIVVTYAGIEGESDILRDLYTENVRNDRGEIVGTPVPELEHITDKKGDPVCFGNGRTFVYWDTVPRMPWQTKEYYDLQSKILRPNKFRQLHMNQWTSKYEDFIPIEWWDEAAKKYERPPIHTPSNEYRSWPLVIGFDIGWKKDNSAIAVVYYDAGRNKIGLFHHKIWEPNDERLFNMIEAVETEIQIICEKFNVGSIIGDPTQFHGAIKRLEGRGLPIQELTQSTRNMTNIGQSLYDVFRTKSFECYPDDEARDHIKFCTAENKGQGFRLTKSENQPNDFAIALAMAVWEAQRNGGVDTSEPLRLEMPFSDSSQMETKSPEEQAINDMLPEPLRS